MNKIFRVGIAAILVGCLVTSPGLFAVSAASADAKEIEPLSHSSPVGTLVLTSGEYNVNLRFQSARGRTFDLNLDKRTGIWTIEGLRFRVHSGRLRLAYKDQVADVVPNSEGKLLDADVASVAALLSVWREETEIAPDLAAAQLAMHQLMAQRLSGSRLRPLDVNPCIGAIFVVVGIALGLPELCAIGPLSCGGGLLVFMGAEIQMVSACGITGCYPIVGVEDCP